MDDLIKDFFVESIENLDRLDSELVKLESDPSSEELLSSIFRTIHTIKGSCGLLSMVDAIRTILSEIQSSGQDGKEDYPDLVENLSRLQQIAQKPESDTPPELKSQGPAKKTQENVERIGEILVAGGSVTQDEVHAALRVQDESRTNNAAAETIRVDVHLLDKLMNLVGELVLTRNQITQFSARQSDPTLTSSTQQLNLLTSELQGEVMKTRMQQISNVFDKFPRVVRDVAKGCGKQVEIEMEGKETELDKSLLEAIKDPLTHIVRNSVDHGIETPDQRVARGKRPEGHLKLRACHEGGQVVIEISDDGAGIDTARVKAKALERGLITPQHAAQMSDRELLNLIFLPGFSTAEKVTNLSGRGVGMDVVKTNIDKVNGSVDLQSTAGKGTAIKIKIPLTLAIVRAGIVQTAGKRFAIPQVSIQELVRLDGDRVRKEIEQVHGVPVYRMRGKLLPLIHLDDELKLKRETGHKAEEDAAINIVVLQADDHPFGLVVDEIQDSEEIVVKPLGKRLKGIKVFAGATIMGDGKVALILDVVGLAQNASILSGVRDRAMTEKADEALEKDVEKQTFLLFAGIDDSRMALPLAMLARLEEFPASQVEESGNELVVQYRGKILPLIRLDRVLEERRQRVREALRSAEKNAGPLQVLVCNDDGETLGLVVEKILDIVEDQAEVKSPATRAGVLYAVVINDRVTELLDVPAIKRMSRQSRSLQIEHAEVSS
jgi:two-component system chemotaxis sensor kinase CheA